MSDTAAKPDFVAAVAEAKKEEMRTHAIHKEAYARYQEALDEWCGASVNLQYACEALNSHINFLVRPSIFTGGNDR